MSEDTNNTDNNQVATNTDAQDELTRVKRNKDEILNEKKALATKYEQAMAIINGAGGEDEIKKIQDIKKENDEQEKKRKLAEGKAHEVYALELASKEAQFKAQLNSEKEEKDNLAKTIATLNNQVQKRNTTEVALSVSKKLNLQDTAYKDIALHILDECNFDDKHNPVFLDSNGNKRYNDKGNDYKVEDFIADKLKDYPHWNKPSVGGMGSGNNSYVTAGIFNGSAKDLRRLRKSIKK